MLGFSLPLHLRECQLLLLHLESQKFFVLPRISDCLRLLKQNQRVGSLWWLNLKRYSRIDLPKRARSNT